MSNDTETLADIVAEMREIRVREFQDFADRIEAAAKRERGDAAAMREALEELVANIEMRASVFDVFSIIDRKTFLDAKAALAAPPRQCDVGTAEEQAERFGAMCNKYYNDEYKCDKRCPLSAAAIIHGFPRCQAYWAQMPYEEGGAK